MSFCISIDLGEYFIFQSNKNTKNVIPKSPFCYFHLPAMRGLKISGPFIDPALPTSHY
ncbi:hypothetical protein SXCC_01741 [Gluconacetobacter sp. SXCC-1]|nr:hypothetical protein SXCC_01741 [Gluconacetobacter sp. SXCC-1]